MNWKRKLFTALSITIALELLLLAYGSLFYSTICEPSCTYKNICEPCQIGVVCEPTCTQVRVCGTCPSGFDSTLSVLPMLFAPLFALSFLSVFIFDKLRKRRSQTSPVLEESTRKVIRYGFALLFVLILAVILYATLIPQDDYGRQLRTQSDSTVGEKVTVRGQVYLHFEGGSASGIEGYSFAIKKDNRELFLRINGNPVSYGKGQFDSPFHYDNNLLNGKTILPDKNYVLTGIVRQDDKYNPDGSYLDILEIKELS